MTTILGILLGFLAVIYAIIDVSKQEANAAKSIQDVYLNLPAFLIVMGGTLASTLIGHPFIHLVHGFKGFVKVFLRKPFNFVGRIEKICEFSEDYNKRGIAGLEEKLDKEQENTLFHDGLTMVTNGYKPEDVMEFMEIKMARHYDKEMIDYYVFKNMAKSAPAFGMVGTLVGLIFMLSIMGSDPSKIGPYLAVALVATFYALVLANLIFNPMGNKMLHHAELNLRIRKMEKDGVWFILKKQHPLFIKDQLSSYYISTAKKERSKK